MFAKIESWLTLGNHHVAASIVYLGLALILGGSTFLDTPKVLATGNGDASCSYTVIEDREGTPTPVTYDGCPDGQYCCGGECISDDQICCDDGTHGDADTCACCDGCDMCNGSSTVSCD